MSVVTLPEWTKQALCAGQYDDRWFPEHGHRSMWGKRACLGCPVMAECREYGMDERHGVWGGLDGPERRALGRGRGRQGLDYDIPECDK